MTNRACFLVLIAASALGWALVALVAVLLWRLADMLYSAAGLA